MTEQPKARRSRKSESPAVQASKPQAPPEASPDEDDADETPDVAGSSRLLARLQRIMASAPGFSLRKGKLVFSKESRKSVFQGLGHIAQIEVLAAMQAEEVLQPVQAQWEERFAKLEATVADSLRREMQARNEARQLALKVESLEATLADLLPRTRALEEKEVPAVAPVQAVPPSTGTAAKPNKDCVLGESDENEIYQSLLKLVRKVTTGAANFERVRLSTLRRTLSKEHDCLRTVDQLKKICLKKKLDVRGPQNKNFLCGYVLASTTATTATAATSAAAGDDDDEDTSSEEEAAPESAPGGKLRRRA